MVHDNVYARARAITPCSLCATNCVQLTWADIILFDLLETMVGKEANALKAHPRLEAYVAAVNERPAIKNLKASEKWYK
jgi:glutathione S-transferase